MTRVIRDHGHEVDDGAGAVIPAPSGALSIDNLTDPPFAASTLQGAFTEVSPGVAALHSLSLILTADNWVGETAVAAGNRIVAAGGLIWAAADAFITGALEPTFPATFAEAWLGDNVADGDGEWEFVGFAGQPNPGDVSDTVVGLFLASGGELPTADPLVAGALWNDTGTVKVSEGPP